MASSPDAPSHEPELPAASPSTPGPPSAPVPTSGALDSTGMALVIGCYTLWGVFPLYFRLLSEAGSVEIIGHRIVWTLATCLLLVASRRRWARLARLWRTPRLLGALAVSGVLVSVNWLVYVYGVNTARTADAALGYFINPLVTVALASLVLRERLRPVHRVSIGLAGAAVVLLVVLQGSLPWISLALAFSFALYGLVKKRIGPQVDALTGLTVESAVVAPVALAYLGYLAWQGQSAWQAPGQGWRIMALLVVAGPVTAVPLLLFAAGTRRVPLSVVGMSQYIAPITQFLLAWAVFHEQIPPARWAAMVLVWAAVSVFIGDAVHQLVRRPRPC
ncbi:EamA family transporter RarD [Actinomyces viscosus]|uniref:Putative chloramphenical resistance permease RarD n=1 Tax=Actinomyces viscosus TaxID=1656 RepID=A0A3S5EWD2_ACTVI|nr:EamA family transporter RarD [Actinomyces viscosus]TFH54129.1 EamA family transporter RarD [Actinomyces viscosus]VEI15349.1 putative chloramphenical resistance permease RarD [Actinomyces viscosus]